MGRHSDGGGGVFGHRPQDPGQDDARADEAVSEWRRLRRESAQVEWTPVESTESTQFSTGEPEEQADFNAIWSDPGEPTAQWPAEPAAQWRPEETAQWPAEEPAQRPGEPTAQWPAEQAGHSTPPAGQTGYGTPPSEHGMERGAFEPAPGGTVPNPGPATGPGLAWSSTGPDEGDLLSSPPDAGGTWMTLGPGEAWQGTSAGLQSPGADAGDWADGLYRPDDSPGRLVWSGPDAGPATDQFGEFGSSAEDELEGSGRGWRSPNAKKVLIASAAAVGVFGATFGAISLLSSDACEGEGCSDVTAKQARPGIVAPTSPEPSTEPADEPADEPSDETSPPVRQQPPVQNNNDRRRPSESRVPKPPRTSEPESSRTPSPEETEEPSDEPTLPPPPGGGHRPTETPSPTETDREPPTGNRSPSPSVESAPTPTPTADEQSGAPTATLKYGVAEVWDGAYRATIKIVNTSGDWIPTWTVSVPINGDAVAGSGAEWYQNGSSVVLQGANSLAPGGEAEVTVSAEGLTAAPETCVLDGGRCTIEE